MKIYIINLLYICTEWEERRRKYVGWFEENTANWSRHFRHSCHGLHAGKKKTANTQLRTHGLLIS